jgi:uncharacterized membrane protein
MLGASHSSAPQWRSAAAALGAGWAIGADVDQYVACKGRTDMTGHVNLAYDYPLLGAFWTMLWIFLWVIWIFLLIRVFVDIFRDDSLNGWAKAGWSIFALVLPFLGVFVYLIARGKNMGVREEKHAQAKQQALNSYLRETLGTAKSSATDELARLSEIKARGDLTDEEFQRAKEKILH